MDNPSDREPSGKNTHDRPSAQRPEGIDAACVGCRGPVDADSRGTSVKSKPEQEEPRAIASSSGLALVVGSASLKPGAGLGAARGIDWKARIDRTGL